MNQFLLQYACCTRMELVNYHSGGELVPAYVMMAACAVGAIALCFTPETAGKSLRGIGMPAGTARRHPAEA